MLIFGWGDRPKFVASGSFPCPVCKTDTNYVHLRHRRWLTFFFIPVIPLSKPFDTVACQKCQSSIPIEAVHGEPVSNAVPSRLSWSALYAMLASIFALLTFCIFSISFPVALCSVIVGHLVLKEIRRSHPDFEGRWQAITGLALGYPALLLSLCVGVYTISQKTPRDEESRATSFGFTESSNEAFKNAEYEIASKRDKPAGRGNSPQAIELANTFASRMNELASEVFTSSRKPLVQLSDGDFLTYCQLQNDRCLFLVHVPSYRRFTKDAKKTLSELAWIVAQSTTAGKFQKQSKLGVALRGVLTYGDICLGEIPASTEDNIEPFTVGKKEDLIAFFELSQTAKPPEVNPFEPIEPDNSSIEPSKPTVIDDIPSESIQKEPEPSRKRKPPPAEAEFDNQIPINLVTTIVNNSWGNASIAFSPNGKWLAVGKSDEKILLFNATNGEQVFELVGLRELGKVNALTFSSDGSYLIAGGYSGQMLFWKVESDGRLTDLVKGFRFESQVEEIIASPKFPFFMGVSRKGTIAWQPHSANASQPRLLQEFTKDATTIWLPTSGDQAKATDGERLLTFSLRNGEISDSDQVGIKRPDHACFDAFGQRLALVDNNTLYLFDLSQGLDKRMLNLPRGERGHAMTFHPNGKWLAVGMGGKVGIADFVKGEWIAFVKTNSVHYQSKVQFAPDGNFLATTSATAQGSIKIFRLEDRAPAP